MKDFPVDPQEQAALLREFVNYLTQGNEWKKNDLAQQLNIQPDVLSKAINLTAKQLQFGGKSRRQLFEQLTALTNLEHNADAIQRFTYKKNTEAANKAQVQHSLPDYPHIFLACTDSVWSNDELTEENLSASPRQMLYAGLVMIDAQWRNVEVRFYRGGSTVAHKTQYGKVEETDTALFLSINETLGERYKKRVSHSHYCFAKSRSMMLRAEVFRGVFSTLNNQLFPVCGEIILVKAKSAAEALERILTPAPEKIQFNLAQKLWRVTEPPPANLNDLPLKDLVNELKKISGTYQGHFFSVHDRAFCEVLLTVRNNGTATLINNLSPTPSQGFVYPKIRGAYMFALDYKKGRFPLLVGALDYTHDLLEGFFGGITFRGQPNASRIRLHRISTDIDLPLQLDKPVLLSDPPTLRQFLQNKKDDFLEFYLGQGDTNRYLDNAQFYLSDLGRNEVDEVGEFAGTYYLYLATYRDTYKVSYIQKTPIKIESNGTALLKSGMLPGVIFDGRFHITDGFLCGEFYEKNNTKQEPLFYFTFPLLLGPADRLSGTYSGRSKAAQRPMAGRAMLLKCSENFQQIRSRNYNLPDDVAELEQDQPTLIPFFLGMQDNMVESYDFFRRNGILPRTESTPEQLQMVAGVYWSLRLRLNGRALNANPAVIHPNGSFELKSTHQAQLFRGIATKNEHNILCLDSYRIGDMPITAHSYFKTWEVDSPCFLGVGISITREFYPLAAREVLLRLDNADFASMTPQAISIPLSGEKVLETVLQFKNLLQANNKFSDQIDWLGLMLYLTGEDGNLISPPRGVIEHLPPVPSPSISQGEIYFAAACYYAGEPGQEEATLYALQKAKNAGYLILHGEEVRKEILYGKLKKFKDLPEIHSLLTSDESV